MNHPINITNQEQLVNYYRGIPDRVHSLTEYVALLEYRWAMQIVYFRGEPRVYPEPCLPSIWRTDLFHHQENETTSKLWTAQEQESIERFQKIVLNGDLSDPYFDTRNPPEPNSTEWLELAQHYGFPTRLLDVTLDPLVALYFAASKDFGQDGCVYLSNGSSLNTLDPGEYKSDLNTFFEIYKLREFTPQDTTLFLYRPLANNRRMIAQRGQFVWCRAAKHSLRATDTPIVVDGDSKDSIKNALERIGYTDEQLISPGLSTDA